MRVDKFLKVSRIIKRRTVAKTLAENDKIMINGKVQKAGSNVKEGDILEVEYFNKKIKVRIKTVPEKHVRKEDAEKLIEIVE